MSHKRFKNKLVPYAQLRREVIDGQRHYVLPDGITKLKSVTTILSEASDKTWLEEWKKNVGEDEVKRVSGIAARRGTAVHNIAENYLLNSEHPYKGHMPFNIQSFKPIKKVLDEHVDDIMGIELPLFSKALKAAGTTDLVAKYDDKLSIIDFKTSKRIKNESDIESYFLQSTVYSMMFEWTYKMAVPQIVIIMTVDDENDALVFVKDKSQYVDQVLKIFRGDLYG